MTSVEYATGEFHVILVYSLADMVRRLFPEMDSTAIRFLGIDARGTTIFGMDKRVNDWVGTREVIDAALAILTDSPEGSFAVIGMADTIRASAQAKGLA
ncbi:MAG TPA: hypothetical protein PKV27_03935 [Ilumatobacteraceae bacterium]|jgi:hypothetical protein|nr:hypothetical protein [Ilumatobacteraceae bacterium]